MDMRMFNNHPYRFLYPSLFCPVVNKWSPAPIQQPPPRRKVGICLDLDETLVRSYEFQNTPDNILPEYQNRLYTFTLMDNYFGWGIKRPYLKEFLRYCHQHFSPFLIWTAGQPDYAQAIVDIIFDEGFYPDAIYTHDHCLTYGQRYTKPLNTIYEDWGLCQNNFVMIDNNPNVFNIKDIKNVVQIPDYDSMGTCQDHDEHLVKLMNYFEQKPFEERIPSFCPDVIFA